MSKDDLIRNELVELAYDLKFESVFGLMWSLEPQSYLLWMEDLHRWVRDKHNMFIEIFREDCFYEYHLIDLIEENVEIILEESFNFFDNYDDALELALKTALEIIKERM